MCKIIWGIIFTCDTFQCDGLGVAVQLHYCIYTRSHQQLLLNVENTILSLECYSENIF